MTISLPRTKASNYRTPLFHWTPEEYQKFGQTAHLTHHRYHELPLFSDAALIDLLDNYPRPHLQAFTMGHDPTRRDEWQCVDIAPETTGEDIWKAVCHGRLWLSLIKVESFNQDYTDLIDGMYDQIDRNCPQLGGIRSSHSVLLISSPGTQLYYHLDMAPNMLWNMRGQEIVWSYPAMHPDLVPQEMLEDIYAEEIDEELPFDLSFDRLAKKFTMEAGDVMWWPRNAPHRLEYPDLNISITTSYHTPFLRRRDTVQLANRFILRELGIKHRSMREDGLSAQIKSLMYRAINRIRPFQGRDSTAAYVTDLLLDPNEPCGFRRLPQKRPAAFANLREKENP
ncbi:MAG: hypothetical protein AAF703_06065 [Cyanobacteria bacterium P01_D01_bin.105]